MGIISSHPLPAISAIQEVARLTQAVRFTNISLLAVCTYDWIVSLEDEIELICELPDYYPAILQSLMLDVIGRASTSVFKFCILATRYSGFLMSILFVLLPHGDWSSSQCGILIKALAASCTIGKLSIPSISICSGDRLRRSAAEVSSSQQPSSLHQLHSLSGGSCLLISLEAQMTVDVQFHTEHSLFTLSIVGFASLSLF